MSHTPDPRRSAAWLRAQTPARIGIGRHGAGVPTAPLLDFQLAHALARDAVQQPLDCAALAQELAQALGGARALHLASAAADRATYLTRPDLGRRLDDPSRRLLEEADRQPCDAALVIVDGLSATATRSHTPALVKALTERLSGWRWAAPVIVTQGRVAIGDEIGALLRADIVLVLIGERPGLSSPDSLGAYLTWNPRVGRSDAQRNCVSNIRPPHGVSPAQAADKLAWLMTQARHRRLTGTALKDEHLLSASISSPPPSLPPSLPES